MATSWVWAVRWTLMLLALALGTQGARANEQVFAALAQRGLEPWPEAFLTEIPFTVGLQGEGLFEAEGYQIRLPRPTPAGMVLAALPGKMVIVDVAAGTGPVALSREALGVLGVGQGDAPQQMQILALRPTGAAVAAVEAREPAEPPTGPPTAQAPTQAPLPPLRPGVASAGLSVAAAVVRDPTPVVEVPQTAPAPVPSEDGDVARIEIGQEVSALLGDEPPATRLALQAGYFSEVGNAERFAGQLEALQIPSILVQTTTAEGALRWKVLAGPFADDAARRAAKARGGDVLRDAYPVELE